jgi:hypothetical protein
MVAGILYMLNQDDTIQAKGNEKLQVRRPAQRLSEKQRKTA